MSVYYQDEHVTLYHGDCLELADVWTCADVLVTDPPYGRAWRQGDMSKSTKKVGGVANAGIANDDTTEIRDGALSVWGQRPAIIFGDLMLAPPAGTKIVAIYAKPNDAGMRGAIAGMRRDIEAIYFTGQWRTGIGGRTSIYRSRSRNIGGSTGVVARAGGHPHAKPTDLMEELIGLTAGVIADPFAGSGSILVAARNLGRTAIGVELEERYCEVIANRLSQGALTFTA